MNVREHPEVTVLQEEARGCGYRKSGGIYLVGDGPAEACGRLPLLCEKCPCCSGGIKPTRGWTWIDLRALVKDLPPCPRPDCQTAASFSYAGPPCPLDGSVQRAGLIWIGTRFYQTPQAFLDESRRMGISRRLPAVPKDFKVGQTWVLLGHRKYPIAPPGQLETAAALQSEPKTAQMIFATFRPQRIEQVLRGNETTAEIDALVKRGIRPVVIEKIGEQTALPETTTPIATDPKPCRDCPFGVTNDGDPACDTCELYAQWDHRRQQRDRGT